MVHAFPEGIRPKVNGIVRLEFELVYEDVSVQYYSHDSMGTPFYIFTEASFFERTLRCECVFRPLFPQKKTPSPNKEKT